MGLILDTPDDEFGVEVRRESFFIHSSEKRVRERGDDGVWKDGDSVRTMWTSPESVEFRFEDIVYLKQALARVDRYLLLERENCACGCSFDAHYGPERGCDGGHHCGTWWPRITQEEETNA